MVTEINVQDRECWNETVRSFPNYDVFYLNEYVTAFMNEHVKNGEPILLLYENGSDHAINVVFKRDVALDPKMTEKVKPGQYFDLVSPYGYGGFWGQVEDYEQLNLAYNQYCVEHHYVCEFVRFELFGNYVTNYDGEIETRTHNVVRNLEMPLDEMWMDFKQKVRKNVKKAINSNLQIVIENYGEYLRDFIDIYYATMERCNAENEYYFSDKFFQTINQMKDNIMYFHVLYEGKVISTELVLYGSQTCYSYLGGTLSAYFELRPNDFLKYEIIKWAKEKGLANYVLGGGYGADDGIFQYKTYLAPHGIVDFFIGRKVFDAISYNRLVDLRAEQYPECRTAKYFPRYRA